MTMTIIVKEKSPPHYIRFGTCLNCGSKIAREGERCEIINLLKIDCPVCGDRWCVPLGFMHNLNSKFAKRILKRILKR